MKRDETPRNQAARVNRRRYAYTKVLDNRKHPIRGLWQRNGRFLARITVETDAGRKTIKWVPLTAATPAEAQVEFRKLLVERTENRVRHIGRCPKFADYLTNTYVPGLAHSGKKPDTIVTETGHLNRWAEAIGGVYLDKIRPSHVNAHLQSLKEAGRSSRTRNLSLVCVRNVLKAARTDGFLTSLPVEGIGWERVEKKSRRLFTPSEIELLCETALARRTTPEGKTLPVTKNGREFADFLRFLALTGAREQEALRVRWDDVDVDKRLVTIGWDADTKNREVRHVDFNSALAEHLRDMRSRRAPDSQWLFPSPQRGERDERAKSLRESLLLVRKAAGMPSFGFHDCRHYFISCAVMAGIDFMTIARWVGHKDGGVLIGRIYGHVANEHRQRMAARLDFEAISSKVGSFPAKPQPSASSAQS